MYVFYGNITLSFLVSTWHDEPQCNLLLEFVWLMITEEGSLPKYAYGPYC